MSIKKESAYENDLYQTDSVSAIARSFNVQIIDEGTISAKACDGASSLLLSDFLLIYIKKGSMDIAAGGKCCRCEEATMFIFSPFIEYDINAVEDCRCRFIDFNLAPYMQRKSLEKLLIKSGNYLNDCCFIKMGMTWNDLSEIKDGKKIGHIAVMQYYVKILIMYVIRRHINDFGNSKLQLYDRESYFLINKAIKYTEDHLSERIDILAIAKNTGVSRSALYNIFINTVSVSPIKFLTRYKMKKAVMMMQQNMAVKEIASRLGYSSPSHFSSTFKSIFGCPPSEWKSQI